MSRRPGREAPAWPARLAALAAVVSLTAGAGAAFAQEEPFVPEVGQPGKDVVWVPTPPELVELMLDLAEVTPKDYLIDLGSGDGRVVIAAARRGATAHGVEYSQNMVELSRKAIADAGVGARATIAQGDMFEADVSKATVLGLFLLPGNLLKLRNTFLSMAPGTRIVTNEYAIEAWEPDRRATVPDCEHTWCRALLWIVPDRVFGTWDAPEGELVMDQAFQFVTGSLAGRPMKGRLNGSEFTFATGDASYGVRVLPGRNVLEGTVTREGQSSPWRATRR